jgi:hypothetical protein
VANTKANETEEQDGTLSQAERKTRMEQAAEASFAPSPYSLRYHPDGSHRMMTIARQNGAGEREITVEDWETNPAYFRAEAGAWRIIKTEAIGAEIPVIY